jgi:hypothetical protein
MSRKKINNDEPIVAICYDFDKTLSPKEMQEYTLFPKLNISAEEFWKESNNFAKENGMDKILSYMKLLQKLINEKDESISLVKDDFVEMGKNVDLFVGLDTWFDRINKYAESLNLKVEHYIISAGLKEIIEGTKIVKKFKEIYASCFAYNKIGTPLWPKQVVNYTTKTQYLFRINKGCLDLSDEETINSYMHNEERRIPFPNMIYIGDSDTDIPAMKVITKENGYAIGVYNPKENDIKKVCNLLGQERINHFAPADYSEGGRLENLIKTVLNNIKSREDLNKINILQKKLSIYLSDFSKLFSELEESFNNNLFEHNNLRKIASMFRKKAIKNLRSMGLDKSDLESAIIYINSLISKTKQYSKNKTKEKLNEEHQNLMGANEESENK